MSEKDGIRLAIECVNRHNHGFIGCHPMFVRGHNEAIKAITKELWSIIETASLGGDYFEGFSEGVKVGQQEADSALREENARLREALTNWDALIRHQYSGSKAAMSDMTACAHETAGLLFGDGPWPGGTDE